MTPPVALTPGVATPGAPSVPGVVGNGAPGTTVGATPGVGGFGALVAAALAVAPGAPAQAEAVTPVAAGATACADLSREAAPADAEEDLHPAEADDKAAQLLGVVVPVALLTVVPVAAPVASPVAAPVTAPVAGAPAAAAAGHVGEEASVDSLGAAPTLPTEPGTVETAGEPAAPVLVAAPTSQGAGEQPDPRQRGGSPAARPESVADTSATTTTTTITTTTQAVAAPEAARNPAPAAATQTATGPVARQTFPEVTRLMSRGEGTHRITLQLRPEGLGEVRVVLTLKEGKVDVRMTSSIDARHALTSDLPELHRLLAAAGATETSVSVRDAQQLTSSSWDGGRSTTASSQDLLGQAGTGQSRHHESPQQTGTPADHIATDGVRDRARASGPTDPATGTRSTGLDVTV